TGAFRNGAAVVSPRSGNTLIMVSAMPGRAAIDSFGTNSPFAAALAGRIGEPKEMEGVLKLVTIDVQAMTHQDQKPDRQFTQLNELVYLNEDAPGARAINDENKRNNAVIAAVDRSTSTRKIYSITPSNFASSPDQPLPTRGPGPTTALAAFMAA